MTRSNTISKPWTSEERALLVKLKADGINIKDIAIAVDHPWQSCQTTYSRMKLGKRMGRRPSSHTTLVWTPEQERRMYELLVEHGKSRRIRWSKYAPELGHSVKACYHKSSEIRRTIPKVILKPVESVPVPARKPLPPPVSIDHHITTTSTFKLMLAAAIVNRIGTQGITAGLLGDPLPGRSALDEKRAQGAQPDAAPRAGFSLLPAPTRSGGYRLDGKITLATEPFRP